MKKLIFGSMALAAIIAGPAVAADMPVKAPPPPPAPVYSWTGCYVGVNAGWIGGQDDLDFSLTQAAGNSPFAPVRATPGPASGLTAAEVAASRDKYTPWGSGFTGGGQVGCNWQSPGSPFVFGAEADFDGSTLKDSAVGFPAARALSANVTEVSHVEYVEKRMDWFSTMRLRLGYAVGPWLPYVTGGLAVAQINSNSGEGPVFANSPNLFVGSGSATRVGWAVGGGFEYAFARNWSAKVEYLYLDFGTFTYIWPTSGPALTLALFATDVHARENVVRVGLNYKLY